MTSPFIAGMLALAAVVGLCLARVRREGDAWTRWHGAEAHATRRSIRQHALLVVAAGVCGAIAATPSAARDTGVVTGTTRPAVVFALDLSRSMEADDAPPTRLGAALSLIAGASRETVPRQIGLVVFAGDALLVCPVTTDMGALRLALEEVPALYETLGGGSALGSGLDRAVSALPDTGGSVVVLSDGESPDEGLADAVAHAIAKGVVVHAVGLGSSEGRRMRERRGREPGPERITRVDDARLRRIAEATGGYYVRWSTTDERPPIEQWLPAGRSTRATPISDAWWRQAALLAMVGFLMLEFSGLAWPRR